MLLNPDTVSQLTQQALSIAHEAGKRIVEVYERDFEVAYKDDNTPVTTADLDANNIIVEALESLPNALPVISEESEQIPYAIRHEWSHFWLVDPLDGTREFIRRNGEFTVNIVKQVGQQVPEPIHVRPAPAGEGELTVARSRCPKVSQRLQAFLDKLGAHRSVPMGSSLKSCLVAEGVADIYVRLGPTSEWDTGAAQCIVEEAGGHITDTQFCDLEYNTRESLLNPHFMVFGDETHNWRGYLSADSA